MAALTTIAAIGLGVSAASSAYTAYESNKASKEAEKVAKAEQGRIAGEQAKALEQRKTLINKQRKQLAGSGFNVNPTTETGLVTGNINQGLLG